MWVAAVVVVALSAGSGYALAGTRAPTKSAARVVAQRMLGLLKPPPGATPTSADPSEAKLLGQAPQRQATPNRVDVHAFWRAPGDPQSVIAWVRAHSPGGSAPNLEGESGNFFSDGTASFVGFPFTPVPGAFSYRELIVSVSAARGGGTAMRADAQVVWLVRRPVSERIPAGVRAVTISDRHITGTSPGPWTVTDHARVHRIVALVDALPAAQPGAVACPADSGPIVTLRFETAATGGRTLARATADGSGCGGVGLWIHGHRSPGLEGGPGLIRQLGSLLGTSLS